MTSFRHLKGIPDPSQIAACVGGRGNELPRYGSRHLFESVLALLLLLGLAQPALAVDAGRAARAMAEQGTKAYEGADFARAAQLYHDAFRTDPSQPVYLYSAARAEHVGGLLDRAVSHYRQFAAIPGVNAGLSAKAKGYIDEVHRAQVDAQVQEAEAASRARHHSAAAQFFLAAYGSDNTRTELLFKAAVAEELAGENATAIGHYRDYLQKAPADASDRNLAKIKLSALEKGNAPPVAVTPQQPKQQAVQQARQPDKPVQPPTLVTPAEPPSRWKTWAVLGGGVALLAGGAGLFASTMSDAEALQKQLDQTRSGKITGTTHTAATTQADSINQTRIISGAMAGVGVVATGVGVWLLLRAPERVVVVPGPGGVVLAGRF